jgi:hypothetical protein
MGTTLSPAAAPRGGPGRLLLALGFGLTALGVVVFVVLLRTRHLVTPWYLPLSATLGAACAAAALWQRRTLWRWLALVLVLLVAGAAWALLLTTRLPAYAGPVTPGKPFPAFATVRADGTAFTQRDLRGDHDNVMVFFRGRW